MRVRGRIDILRTTGRRLLERGRVACHFDQLTTDTPRNRIVRSALESIAHIVRRPDLRYRCRSLASDFALLGVSAVWPVEVELVGDRFGRHDANDRTMVRLAQLACELALPTEDVGIDPLYAPSREISWVRRLYERAVLGFYSVMLDSRGWTVRGGQTLRWPVDASTDALSAVLPNMRKDLILDLPSTRRRVVIDTKFNAIVTKGWYRDETLRSGYLYQMYAYLRSQEGDSASNAAEGLLLHPSVG